MQASHLSSRQPIASVVRQFEGGDAKKSRLVSKVFRDSTLLQSHTQRSEGPSTSQSRLLGSRTRSSNTASPSIANQEPTVEFLGSKDGVFEVRGVVICAAPADVVYDVLTDYNNLSSTFDNISHTEVIRTANQLQLRQLCGWEFLIFSGTMSLLLSVDEQPADRLLVFNLIHSSFMKSFIGSWQVFDEGVDGCRVEHYQQLGLRLPPPAVLGGYMQPVFRTQVNNILQDLRTAVEERRRCEDMVLDGSVASR